MMEVKVKLKTKPQFNKYETLSLGVSLNSRNHEGAALEEIIKWMNTQDTMKKCVIDLSDTLHRHNFIADGMSPEEAHRKAYRLGSQWINQNSEILNKLNVPFEIIRWDSWLSHPKFLMNRIFFERALTKSNSFRKAIHTDIENFLSRRGRVFKKTEIDKAITGCMDYLIEELAVHSIFFDEIPSISVYPGRQQASFKLIRNGLVPNVPTGMQQSDYAGLFMYFLQEETQKIAA